MNCFCDVIIAGDNVAFGVSGNGEYILNVIGQRRRAVQEEEGLEVGALVCAEPRNLLEAADDGLDKQRAVCERGDREEMDVFPGLVASQGTDGEAGAPA